MSERERFEAWVQAQYGDPVSLAHNGVIYSEPYTMTLFVAWEARARLADDDAAAAPAVQAEPVVTVVRHEYTDGNHPENGFSNADWARIESLEPGTKLYLHPPTSAVPAVNDHPDDEAVDRFAEAMKTKLRKKRDEGRGGWEDKEQCSQEFLSSLLHEHAVKGDPVDVANLAMMLHQRGESIAPPPAPAGYVLVRDAERIVMRKGYCSDCDNNPDESVALAARAHGNPCNGCWFTDEKANWESMNGKQYYADDGTLMNADGTRSIFDDVDA